MLTAQLCLSLCQRRSRKAEAEPTATRAMVYEAKYKEMIREN